MQTKTCQNLNSKDVQGAQIKHAKVADKTGN